MSPFVRAGYLFSRCFAGVFLFLAANLFVPNAGATVNVSGPIVANTTWTLAQSPYVVTGDIFLQSGATLQIEAGVTVYMSAGTNFTVEKWFP